ncbi:MAG TPA: sialidase family protein [Opitutaceae bacterium]|nr:sialidase family protein [Opitutaceae bacterium]
MRFTETYVTSSQAAPSSTVPRRQFLAQLAGSLAVGGALLHQLGAEPLPPVSTGLPPLIDLANDLTRQVVIARGDATTYQGHPTTVLLPDGKTLFAVWSYDHGGVCGPLKRSDDGGVTWSQLIPVPENWKNVKNCPSLYRLKDPQRKARLFVYAGQGPDGNMHQAYSEDDGKTWSPMQSNGLLCVMPFCTIMPINGGKRLLGLTNIRRPGEKVEVRSNVVAQSHSDDGGFTWTPLKVIVDLPGLKPCEPCLVRSPSGRQLLCLIRENSRTVGSLFMTSDDEGRSWSQTRSTPEGLFGDRHMAQYADDGRLVVCFRDVGVKSPTRNHFVAWIGRYEDIIQGRAGDYRLKLLHSFKGSDCGYPGLERLPDGTFVATTYIKYREGPEKNSVVSSRFKLSETDLLAKRLTTLPDRRKTIVR